MFFAKGRELTGTTQAEINLPSPATGAELLKSIISSYPKWVFSCDG